MQKHLLEEEHILFQESVRAFMKKEVAPHNERWEKEGKVDRELWLKAGEMGLLCTDFPIEYGGLGIKDYRYNVIVSEELARVGTSGPGFTVQNDIIAPFTNYFNEAQKKKYMAKIAKGEIITAIAMTEPGTGSDLANVQTTAVKKGNSYVLNGAKMFITNGIMSDLVIVVAKTNPDLKHKGISLFLVERGMKGFTRGRNLDKIGLRAQDTAELFFENVEVPVENLLGEENRGFYYLVGNLPQERLSLAASGIASTEFALEMTIQYCNERKAFGRKIGAFQHSRFKLAEMKTEITIGRTFVDQCIEELNANTLTAEKAAMAKYWITELQGKVVDQCLQLHGGYGFMREYPIGRAYTDARAQRIYGGTTEIMKEIIGRSMGF